MTDLTAAVPPHEPAEDAFSAVAKMGLAVIPVVGPLAAEAVAHALSSRQAERQHEFNLLVARELGDVLARLGEAPLVEGIVQSDEFLAAVTRAQRVAAETGSAGKRRRLAAAAAQSGEWAPFSRAEREQFARLVEDFGDLHVWLLHFFADPHAWLAAHGRDLPAATGRATIDDVLALAIAAPRDEWTSAVSQALGDLDRAGLAFVPLHTTMTRPGTLQSRTTERGRRFLGFLGEEDSSAATAPGIA